MSRSGHNAVRRAVAVLGVLLAGLVAAPTASASSEEAFPIGGAEFERARQIGLNHWGASPCGGEVRYVWAGLEPLTNATARWSNPTDAWNNPGANFDCSVTLNSLTQYDFPMLCTVMTHELGHLLGKDHEEREGQLMSPIYTAPIAACGGTEATKATDDHEAVARQSRARPNNARASKRKRCIVRLKAGRRTRRCIKFKRRAPRARTATARTYTAS